MRLLLARCAIVLLVICLANCSAWHATQAPLPELAGKKIRVTTRGGDKQEGKLVQADSLGFAVLQDGSLKSGASTIDTTTIVVVEKRGFSAGRTFALVAAPFAFVGVLYILATKGAFSVGD